MSEPWENSNHPLFIHHSDQPGAVLVAQPLVEDNYTTWAQSMSMTLMIKNKKGFIDGTIQRSTQRVEEQLQWDRCNTLVKTWLLGSMSKEISNSIIHCKTARGMWQELQERFSHTNTVQLFHIENAIHDCKQGTSSVTSFFTKLKSLWNEKDVLCEIPPCICEVSKEIKAYMDTQKTMKFLMGLNDNYATIRSSIVNMESFPIVNQAYSMALRQEKQAELSTGKAMAQPEATAFAMRRGNRENEDGEGAVRCEKCNKTNHSTKNCRAHLKCTFCNSRHHTFEYCRRRKAIMGDGQGSSKANNAVSFNDKKETAMNFPF
ncbi:uncharacterized protein LOC133708658 [Rosa rugosa]|uniref:uncharacterized protein LOC133708658 n=1 Tax=Rosa rugosa TaxID=74645 RepID=UPI002B40DF7D|nr:uncharacterized protein LOC133708658 [Rosa rugosa]